MGDDLSDALFAAQQASSSRALQRAEREDARKRPRNDGNGRDHGGGRGSKRRSGGSGRGRGRAVQRDSSGLLQRSSLHRSAISGRLWYHGCQSSASDLAVRVPTSFLSTEAYQTVFAAMIHEEARAAIRSSFNECADQTQVRVEVSAGPDDNGWHQLTVSFPSRGVREHDYFNGLVVVLTSRQPPRRGALGWLSEQTSPARSGAQKQASATLKSSKSTTCTNEVEEGEILPAPVDPRARGSAATPEDSTPSGRGARMAPTPLVTLACIVSAASFREGRCKLVLDAHPACENHTGVDSEQAECTKVMLAVRPDDTWWMKRATSLITQQRECEAVQSIGTMGDLLQPLLRPQQITSQSYGMWPQSAVSKQFFDFLHHSFDMTQLHAIEQAVGCLGAREKKMTHRPFTLIQGPPGTGKTHTIRGILNVWHIVPYQQHYKSIETTLRSLAYGAKESGTIDCLNWVLQEKLPSGIEIHPLPKILVCAPSNGAVDELLERVLLHGFVDLRGTVYRPEVVRVGSSDAPISAQAKRVFSETQIRQILDMSPSDFEREMESSRAHLATMTETVEDLRARLMEAPESPALPKLLAEAFHSRCRHLRRLERFEIARKAVVKRDRSRLRQVEEKLEQSFLSEAQIVFATLSSSGRRNLRRLCMEFPMVLIDEACQAPEPAAVQALVQGATNFVLVGDPQQLPATILSQQILSLKYERSLFERLAQCGSPVHGLSVQYRMHPEIRFFPSKHFYDSRLRDAQSVEHDRNQPFYAHAQLQPYRIFDASSSQERRKHDGSVSNVVEAEIALALVLAFFKAVKRDGARKYEIGVITPYRQQRDTMRAMFKAALHPLQYEAVKIETVDAFQGKQVDVAIFSCVRASSKSGIGFVADIRRLNVAITRAKKAMWIVGNFATLQRNQVWASLLEDAREREVVLDDATPSRITDDEELLAIVRAAGRTSREQA